MRKLLCYFGLHSYTIIKIVDDKGQLLNYDRLCDNCDKEQELKRPPHYNPVAFIWTDKQKQNGNIPNNA